MSQREAAKGKAPIAGTIEASSANNQSAKEIAMTDSIVSVREDQIQAIVGELVSEDGRIYTTSMQVAEHFGKAHRSVLLAIRRMECSDSFRLHNFVQTVVTRENPSGGAPIQSPAYRITRDGFVFLAMGFTGKEAAAWKEAYITAFNQMEAELKRIKYVVNPDDVLTGDQAETLRLMLKTKADLLPKSQQGSFMMKGWSKLKSHFKVGYRQIPQSEYTEAMSIVTRHVAEWELVEDEPRFHASQYETLNQLLARLAKQLAEPNGYSVITFMPLYEVICQKLGHSPRYVERLPELLADPGFDIEPQLLSQINQASHQRLMQKLADAYEGMEMLGTAIRRIKGPKPRALPA
ncbi:MAG: Rha family transcriptional regulator [Brachymonas sp.]|nr:Rha family transcriptional regulator [Brachymonas sp.]